MTGASFLPRGWSSGFLGDIRRHGGGSIVPAESPSETFELYSVPSFPSGHPETVEGRDIGSNKQLVEDQSVLVCKINPRINRVWTVRRRTKQPLIASTEWIAFPPVEGVLPDYLRYYLTRDDFREHLATNVSGVGGSLMRVRPRIVDEYPLVLAPLPEQHRIVAAIEEHLTKLEAAIAALKRAHANARRYCAALLEESVNGSIEQGDVNAWRPLGSLVQSIRNGISAKPDAVDGLRILRISAVRPLKLDLSDVRFLGDTASSYDACDLANGDVLFTRYNGNADLVAACAVVNALSSRTVYPDKLIRVRVLPDLVLPEFLALAASTGRTRDELRSFVKTTAGQAGISGSDLKRASVPVPPIAVQRLIAGRVSEALAGLDRLEAQVVSGLKRAAQLRQAILKRAFEGNLVPQDPADEPASARLGRIRPTGGTPAPTATPTRRPSRRARKSS